MINLPIDESVEVRLLEQMLDYSAFTNSYKLYWFYGIYKEILEGNQQISFRRIVCRMVTSCWHSITRYRLNLGSQDKLGDLVAFIRDKYNIEADIREEELMKFLEEMNSDRELTERILEFYKYVPYRLLTPFYAESLVGQKDAIKNDIIKTLSSADSNVFYKILIPNKVVHINDRWFNYIIKNQIIILGWINYKLIYFLQKRNPNVPSIPFKLNLQHQRNLNKAKKFWKDIFKIQSINDLYTKQGFTAENYYRYGALSIDHFIPWSFVLHDELWNLIPTFRNINSSKSDKLPEFDRYINGFCETQFKAFTIARQYKFSKTYLEDYLTVNNKIRINDLLNPNHEISKEEFSDSLKKTMMPLFQIAYNQGYDVWYRDKIII